MVEMLNDDIEKWRNQQIYKKLTDARQIIANRDARIGALEQTMSDIKRTADEAGYCYDGCREAINIIAGLTDYAISKGGAK